MEAKAFSPLFGKLGIKKAAFLATNNDFGLGASKEFSEMLKANGAQVGVMETMDPKATDFSAQLAKIKASGGDTLFVTTAVEQATLILKQAREQQVKARIIVGVATFFDAFDALAIASILPVIVPLWKLTPPQIGLMISAGFLGQLLGALLFGWIAERYGRMTAMIWSIALFGIMSLVCALAWDYNSLLVFRTIQGIGLGGEVPVAAVFISELAKAQGRGRFVLLYELVFPIGLVAASLVGLWVCLLYTSDAADD